jgi:lipopolysaccharide biosynthesis regulator YciM
MKRAPYRRIYSYRCKQCGFKRKSYKFKVFKDEVCRKCRKNKPNENQLSLIGQEVNNGN